MIISLSGKARSGKDTIAKLLVEEYGFKKFSFADRLKLICSDVFDLNSAYFFDDSLKDNLFDKPKVITVEVQQRLINIAGDQLNQQPTFPELPTMQLNTPRQMLQIIGTDVFRSWDKNFWINAANIDPKENIVFTDARMANEREYARSLGGCTILIKRPHMEQSEASQHKSENDLGEESEYNIILINDTSVFGLERQFKIWYYYKYIERKL